MQDHYLVVLPKFSSYQFQDSLEKMRLKKFIERNVSKLSDIGYQMVNIAEDNFATELFKENNRTIVSTIAKLDRAFIQTNSDTHDGYIGMGKCLDYPHFYKQSAAKYKILPRSDFGGNDKEYESYKMDVYGKRIRHTMDGYYEEFPAVLFFDKNNNYATKYKPRLGDKKLYVEFDLNTELAQYYFTGQAVTEDTFYKIAEGLYDT